MSVTVQFYWKALTLKWLKMVLFLWPQLLSLRIPAQLLLAIHTRWMWKLWPGVSQKKQARPSRKNQFFPWPLLTQKSRAEVTTARLSKAITTTKTFCKPSHYRALFNEYQSHLFHDSSNKFQFDKSSQTDRRICWSYQVLKSMVWRKLEKTKWVWPISQSQAVAGHLHQDYQSKSRG